MSAEGWYADRSHDEEEIQLGDWIIQRRCPHLRGDLSRFGETRGSILTCTMHRWQYDLSTGPCLTTDDDSYRIQARAARPVSRHPAASGPVAERAEPERARGPHPAESH